MPLRIATFNLKDFFLPRQDDEAAVVEAKVANVAKNLRAARADVVALQEVGSVELLERLVTRELEDLGYGAPVCAMPDRRGIRNAVLSRVPVLWSQVHAPRALPFPRLVDADPEPFGDRIPLRRGVVHVRVDGGSLGEVDVLAVHFKAMRGVGLKTMDGREIESSSPHAGEEALVRSLVLRVAEALYLRRLVDDVFQALPDHAVCVAGDLNDGAASVPVQIVRGQGPPQSRQLRACFDLVPPEKRFSFETSSGGTLIDHMLVSEKLFRSVGSVELFNEELRYHGPFLEDAPLSPDSDHALGVVEFSR